MNTATRFAFRWSGMKRIAGIVPIVILVGLGQWAVAGLGDELNVTGTAVDQPPERAALQDDFIAEELDLGTGDGLIPKRGFRGGGAPSFRSYAPQMRQAPSRSYASRQPRQTPSSSRNYASRQPQRMPSSPRSPATPQQQHMASVRQPQAPQSVSRAPQGSKPQPSTPMQTPSMRQPQSLQGQARPQQGGKTQASSPTQAATAKRDSSAQNKTPQSLNSNFGPNQNSRSTLVPTTPNSTAPYGSGGPTVVTGNLPRNPQAGIGLPNVVSTPSSTGLGTPIGPKVSGGTSQVTPRGTSGQTSLGQGPASKVGLLGDQWARQFVHSHPPVDQFLNKQRGSEGQRHGPSVGDVLRNVGGLPAGVGDVRPSKTPLGGTLRVRDRQVTDQDVPRDDADSTYTDDSGDTYTEPSPGDNTYTDSSGKKFTIGEDGTVTPVEGPAPRPRVKRRSDPDSGDKPPRVSSEPEDPPADDPNAKVGSDGDKKEEAKPPEKKERSAWENFVPIGIKRYGKEFMDWLKDQDDETKARYGFRPSDWLLGQGKKELEKSNPFKDPTAPYMPSFPGGTIGKEGLKTAGETTNKTFKEIQREGKKFKNRFGDVDKAIDDPEHFE